jgi:hypothetical protein
MDVFWLIGFSGWRAIECYSPSVVLSGICRQPVASVLANDPGLPEIERAYKERRAAAQTLIDAADVETALWPPDIPRPNVDRDAFNDAQYKVAFDLTLLAVAFLAFHEFRHVIFGFEKDIPADQREEELACDVWAREYVTAKLAAYAQSNGHSYHEVLRKRSMAFALAALVISEITPFWEHGGNTKYFSVAARIQAIVDNTPLPDTDHFWIFVASLLVGIYRQRTMPISAPPLLAKQLAQHLIDGL